jgi:hypothetical protein
MSNVSPRGSATQWAIMIMVAIIAAAMLYGLWPEGESFEQATGLNELEFWPGLKSQANKESDKLEIFALGALERAQVEAWIIENDLNRYGDPQDTLYTGGTPLFNEETGETTDRFEYLIDKYPDKPWKN